MKKGNASDFMMDILKARTPDADELVRKASEQLRIAEKVHQLRRERGLSQRALAKLVGTQASVICRLEDADYQGHSLKMLGRIAECLGHKLTVEFVPDGDRVLVSNEKASTYQFRQKAVQPASAQSVLGIKQTLVIWRVHTQTAIACVKTTTPTGLAVVETKTQISFPATENTACARDFAAA
jgi:transcriptional regulator with XRE-family HTH domain